MNMLLEHIKKGLRRMRESELGATAVEYGIMVALIAVVIIAAVFGIGQALKDDFECVEDALGYGNSSYSAYEPC